MEIGKSWLETVLKRQSFENSPTTVADFKLQGSNIKKGQNFLSKIDRLEATAILGSGRRKKINFIVKNQHVTKHMKQFTLETGIFIREIMSSWNSCKRFIDFQLTYVATPDRDLAYFLYSSARPEVVEGHFDEILQAYCDSLKGYLAKFKYEGFVPGVENVKEMLRKRTILTLGDSMMVFPFILCDFAEAPDLEDILKNESAGEKDSKLEWSAMEHLSIEAENVIKASFKRAIAHGLI
ncbi:unnamed protein product [Nesidiocoris tenuis]|uniref:CHK kinase-like domain-containing protein n=1 Tax=Nesidiocoris tenuis TaxID=355587 RepID=A0A6H5G1W5_9HEMI|nr:unnamed protein product [Nesidiocoris tenuis]